MKIINTHKKILGILIAVAVVVAGVPSAYAATTASSKLSQSITAGVISTSIRDAGGTIVPTPSFSLSAGTASTSVQTTTGTFGSSTQRITVDNPNGADNGWTLALAGTAGASEVWTNGTATYPFNGTTTTGQLTIDPSAATLTVASGTATGVTKGTSSAFTSSTPITLLTASTAATKVWNGYITGVGVSQIIPASTPIGTYTINLTQTVTAS